MNARALITWCSCALVAIFADTNPFTRIALLLAFLNVLVSIAPVSARLRPLMLGAGAGAVLATVISSLFDHAGTHILTTLPTTIPGVGGRVTVEGLAYGGGVGIGLAAALVAAATLTTALESTDFIDAFPMRLQRTASVVATALGLLPRLRQAAVAVTEAQRMRGWQPKRLRRAADVVVPVVLYAVEDSLVLGQAMEARGFGAGPRTSLWASTWTVRDSVAALSALAAVTLIVVARIAGLDVDWFPFPTFVAPPLELAGITAAMLLSVAAWTWRR